MKRGMGLANIDSCIFFVQKTEKQATLKIFSLENICMQTEVETQLVEF